MREKQYVAMGPLAKGRRLNCAPAMQSRSGGLQTAEPSCSRRALTPAMKTCLIQMAGVNAPGYNWKRRRFVNRRSLRAKPFSLFLSALSV